MSATVDHIIPVSRGGHPSDSANLQLAHLCCNRSKANKLMWESKAFQQGQVVGSASPTVSNNDLSKAPHGLPWTLDWTEYRYNEETETSNAEELYRQAEALYERGFVITARGIQKR